jgi:hypothetical protein
MAVKVRRLTRLRFYDLALVGGVEFWDFNELPDLPVLNDDQYYQVQSNDRIDLLAQRFYGDARLWWVIAAANDIELLPVHLVDGLKLRIPSKAFVQQQLFKKA